MKRLKAITTGLSWLYKVTWRRWNPWIKRILVLVLFLICLWKLGHVYLLGRAQVEVEDYLRANDFSGKVTVNKIQLDQEKLSRDDSFIGWGSSSHPGWPNGTGALIVSYNFRAEGQTIKKLVARLSLAKVILPHRKGSLPQKHPINSYNYGSIEVLPSDLQELIDKSFWQSPINRDYRQKINQVLSQANKKIPVHLKVVQAEVRNIYRSGIPDDGPTKLQYDLYQNRQKGHKVFWGYDQVSAAVAAKTDNLLIELSTTDEQKAADWIKTDGKNLPNAIYRIGFDYYKVKDGRVTQVSRRLF